MATQTKTITRLSLKRKKCANPLFVKWIKEFIEEAVEKDLASRFGYRKALKSLMSYPLKLQTGKACGILEDFGPKLCARLDTKLALHQQTTAATAKATPPKKPCKNNTNAKINKNVLKPSTSTATAYTISDDDDELPRSSSSTGPPTNGLALPLRVPPIIPSCNRSSPTSSPAKRRALPPSSPIKKGAKETVTNMAVDDLILQPGGFQILLVVDNAELLGKTKGKESATRTELTSLGVNFEARSLKVGDYAWVAQETNSGKELVLPYIVERKRMDDLSSSIMDGRYHEQKYRLKQCGIQNLIYLIESMGKGDLHVGLPLKTLQQASINTQIHGDFSVKHTSNHRLSMEYLVLMTTIITRAFKDKVLVQCPKENLSLSGPTDEIVSLMNFQEFNKAASKIRKWTVHEMFIKHLVQLRGMSVEKAMAIVERYPSPRALLAGYEHAGSTAHMVLAKLPYGTEGKSVGPVISTAVHKLYTSNTLS